VIGPPDLGNKADPTIVEAYPRPDWYFLWYFALLALVPSEIEDTFIIAFPLLLGLAFFLLPIVAPTGERSPLRRPWAVGIVGFATLGIIVLVIEGVRAPWSPLLAQVRLPAAVTASLSGDAARGADLYQVKGCINCHRLADTGGQRGPDLTHIGARLGVEQMTTRILAGGRNMPAYGDALTPEEVSALVTFLNGRR
jgi:ubiquinol-cytochrome c reductase cytochrome b subunit